MRKILVVDDETFLLDGLAKALQSDSTEVKTVETGQAALQEVAKTPYHLCFLDICLPDLDGIEVLKTLKEISPKLTVIMMSAGVVTSAMQEAIEKHADMFLTKPFDLLQVKMLAKNIIEEGIT